MEFLENVGKFYLNARMNECENERMGAVDIHAFMHSIIHAFF